MIANLYVGHVWIRVISQSMNKSKREWEFWMLLYSMHHACDVFHHKNFIQLFSFNVLTFYLQCLILKARIIKNWSVMSGTDGLTLWSESSLRWWTYVYSHLWKQDSWEREVSLQDDELPWSPRTWHFAHSCYVRYPVNFFFYNHASFTSAFATAGYFVMWLWIGCCS